MVFVKDWLLIHFWFTQISESYACRYPITFTHPAFEFFAEDTNSKFHGLISSSAVNRR